jgi:hypothetical protein
MCERAGWAGVGRLGEIEGKQSVRVLKLGVSGGATGGEGGRGGGRGGEAAEDD